MRLPALLLLALVGCSAPPLMSDPCNTPEQALTAPCVVALGEATTGHVSFSGDEDWYGVRLPADVTPRTLVQVRAGYAARTSVQLGVRLEEAGTHAMLAQATDAHGNTRAASPVVQHVRATAGGAVLVRLADVPTAGGAPAADIAHAYEVAASLVEDPDAHEPNDTTATALSPTASGDVQVANVQGALSVPGDVDRFSLAASAGRILWARLSAPAADASPVALALLDPAGEVLATAVQAGGTGDVVVALPATRLRSTGTYQLLVRREAPSGDTEHADPAQTYALEVRLLDEADGSEGATDNDAPARATPLRVGVSPGTSGSATGRLSSAGDEDWYAVELGAVSRPTLLRYRLVPLTTGGRFPAPQGLGQRRVQAFTQVQAGGDVAARQQACLGDATVCPRGSPLSAEAEAVRTEACQRADMVLCLEAARFETAAAADLGNFAGTLHLPPASSTRQVLLRVEAGGAWADDRDWRLEVAWEEDADEAARTQEAPPLFLADDASGATFPAPPAQASTTLSGLLTYGGAAHGPQDYDAREDVDTFSLLMPGLTGEPLDRTLAVQWEVERLADGGVPGALELGLTFCDGDALDGGACTPVSTHADGSPLAFVHREAPAPAWHTPANAPASSLQPLTALALLPGAAQVTVQPYACSCLEPRFVRGGTLQVRVRAEARDDWAPVRYTVRLAQTAYPRTYAVDGGTASCPAPEPLALADGGTAYAPGCRFAGQ